MRNKAKLVDGETLLDTLFDHKSRPSIGWLRDARKRGFLPFVKAGRLVRYDIEKVRKALER